MLIFAAELLPPLVLLPPVTHCDLSIIILINFYILFMKKILLSIAAFALVSTAFSATAGDVIARSVRGNVKTAFSRAGDGLITETPKGDYKVYSRAGKSLMDDWDGLYEIDQAANGFMGEIVFGENNKVWIRNLLAFINADNWVEGTLDGNKIIIPTGQPLAKQVEGTGMVYLWPGKLNIIGEGDEARAEITVNQQPNITFTVNGDKITLDTYTTMNDFIGGFVDMDGELMWNGFGDFATEYTLTDIKLPVVPSDLETRTFDWIYTNPNAAPIDLDNMAGFKVKAGVKDGKLYVIGLNNSGIIVGDIDGGKVSFADGEMAGMMSAYAVKMYGADTKIEETDWGQNVIWTATGAPVVFDFDANTFELTNPSSAMALNTNEEIAWPLAGYIDPVMTQPATGVLTPKQPAFTDVNEYENMPATEPNVGMALRSSDFTTDNKMMDRSKLYFRFWVNSSVEPYVFDKSLYTSLSETIVDVPLTLNDNDFFISLDNYQNYYLFVDELKSIKACLVYKDGDTEVLSEPAIWENVAIDGVETDATVAPVEYYNLNGVKVVNPSNGIFIRRCGTDVSKVIIK